MNTDCDVAVVGAVNVDIGGKPFAAFRKNDSNPGQVRLTLGGVGRNIAHNLALLGNHVQFITAAGTDENGRELEIQCQDLGIDISGSYRSRAERTSSYLYIDNEKGELMAAVSDMEIVRNLTPEFLADKMEGLNSSKALVLDTNLPEETVAALSENAKIPVFAEPVSTVKAMKLKNVLSLLHTITPNTLEASALSDLPLDLSNRDDYRRVGEALLQKGVKHVVITAGDKGAYCCDREGEAVLPALKGKQVNGNGCGDALMAGLVTGFVKDLPFQESVCIGMAAAVCTLETEKTNNDSMTLEMVMERAKEIKI